MGVPFQENLKKIVSKNAKKQKRHTYHEIVYNITNPLPIIFGKHPIPSPWIFNPCASTDRTRGKETTAVVSPNKTIEVSNQTNNIYCNVFGKRNDFEN